MPTINTPQGNASYDHFPDVCPVCHHAVCPSHLSSTATGAIASPSTVLELAFQCTHRNCLHMFIGMYICYGMIGEFEFRKAIPVSFKAPPIDEEIAKLSPAFVDVFMQASEAEAIGLDEITGVGFRKSLEFLIKDYCISKHPEEKETIKAAFLGNVINDHVDEIRIKNCAKRAAWLGNDETHYVKKWEDKDIKDLKILIRLTCGWISSVLLSDQYMTDMS